MTRTELSGAVLCLRNFLARYRKHLGRKEVQSLVETYVRGLLSDTHKKNAEAIAWEVGDGRVRALQRLLVSARWNQEAVVAEHQGTVAELLGSDDGILVIDDTGFRKKGVFSCGVGRQYSGTLGKVENCQVGVFLSYAVPRSTHVWTERPGTYVPRRKGKRGPRPTKPRLTKGAARSRPVENVARQLSRKAFKPVILREGEKGPIPLEVAAIRVWNRRGELPGRQEWLLVVRRFEQTPETKYLFSNASEKTSKMAMVHAGLARSTEEQCFEQGKDDLGLDEYQTKTWPGWHRHATLVSLAHCFLIWMDAQGEKSRGPGEYSPVAEHRRACA